jgi:hypothetical protein
MDSDPHKRIQIWRRGLRWDGSLFDSMPPFFCESMSIGTD